MNTQCAGSSSRTLNRPPPRGASAGPAPGAGFPLPFDLEAGCDLASFFAAFGFFAGVPGGAGLPAPAPEPVVLVVRRPDSAAVTVSPLPPAGATVLTDAVHARPSTVNDRGSGF